MSGDMLDRIGAWMDRATDRVTADFRGFVSRLRRDQQYERMVLLLRSLNGEVVSLSLTVSSLRERIDALETEHLVEDPPLTIPCLACGTIHSPTHRCCDPFRALKPSISDPYRYKHRDHEPRYVMGFDVSRDEDHGSTFEWAPVSESKPRHFVQGKVVEPCRHCGKAHPMNELCPLETPTCERCGRLHEPFEDCHPCKSCGQVHLFYLKCLRSDLEAKG